ncbi:MAG: hypothetical protein JXM71_06560 [Spirochaetales bacterium]|nr:hypothetical protein [Spirochaetales bacterium]
MKKLYFLYILSALCTSVAFTQTATPLRLEPVFPAAPEGLIWVEAEDAVTTNFANAPTLDYGSSSFRMIQLNREGTSTAAPFYAEYTVVIHTPGTWSLWVGGTPPGPQVETTASFISPLHLSIDGAEPVHLYREQVAVNERYSTVNYWFTALEPLELTEGVHTFRFEVSETRKYDSRYYFSLDAFFLLASGSAVASGTEDRAALPDRFPKNLADRTINTPYLSIPQYEYSIQTAPKERERYLLLAQVYNLIGDNASAAKTLSRGRVVAGDDPRFTLQMAKSRFWSGEIDEGLRLYREYLASPGADPSVWAEAAKMSAWLMKYQEAEELYVKAIELFPDDLNLRVNYALTLLWEGKVRDGERLLSSLWTSVKDDADSIIELGQLYLTNGYPDKAIQTWSDGIEAFPERLALYLLLIDTYGKSGQAEQATLALERIGNTFAESPRLASVLAAVEQQAAIKTATLEGYTARLRATPDNLELRQELVRAYYWNGMLSAALGEIHNILANKMFAIFKELDGDLAETYRLLDALALYETPVGGIPAAATEAATALRKAGETLLKASARNDQALRGKDAKRQAKTATELEDARRALLKALAYGEALLDWIGAVTPEARSLVEMSTSEALALVADEEMLSKLAPWLWNPDADLSLLASISGENPLAYHVRARMLLLLGRGAPSAPDGEPLEATRVSLVQAELWETGTLPADAFVPEDYYSHGPELAKIALTLTRNEPRDSAFDDGTVARASYIEQQLLEQGGTGTLLAKDMADARRVLLERARARMALRSYQYDSETQQDRRELAEVYLGLDRPDDAALALARVLAVSPSDSASMFTLGRAMEMSGDWSGAMKKYREVFDLNPRYANAVSSYNRLAGTHAPGLEARLSTTIDTGDSSTISRLAYGTPLGSSFELDASYTIRHNKIHAPASGTFPESVTLHSINLEVPAKIRGTGVTIFGALGGTAQNKLDNFLPASVADYSLETVSDYVVVSPSFKAGASWLQKGAEASLEYSFDQVEETYYRNRSAHYEHVIDIGGSYYAENSSRSFARSLSGRLNAGARGIFQAGVDDAAINTLLRVSGEARLGSVIVASPQVTLDLAAVASYQDATDTSPDDYYAPDRVITVQGGPEVAIRTDSGDTTRLSASARFWPGYYAAAGDGRLSMDGTLSLGFERRDMMLSIDAGLTWTAATDTAVSYWSGSIGASARMALGDYIIQ